MKPAFSFLILIALASNLFAQHQERPNIIWMIVDDMSAEFSCYGETLIETPHLDHLAQTGVRFSKAFVTAPVCSTNRSAFITGMYQTSIGAHHHRSGRGNLKIHLPKGIRPVPELFQEAGYHTSNTRWPEGPKNSPGKTDYNFEWDRAMYDSNDWSQRKPGQPFFAQIQLRGGKLRGKDQTGYEKLRKMAQEALGSTTDPSQVTLPPYYPDLAILREDWAAYLDSIRITDTHIGTLIDRLKEEGDFENTVILFMTDHGISHARGKQFLYEEGLHVPLVIAGPGIEAGQNRDDLVEHIDIAALSLGLAGIPIPGYMQAKDILSPDYEKRDTIFAARDRCDETVDYLRGLRTQRYKYIRNFLPHRPHLQPNRYKDGKDIIKALRNAHGKGVLDATQEKILFAPHREAEELYDLENDPYELNNLATDPSKEKILMDLRARLDNWITKTNDPGPESAAMYDSDMLIYLKSRNGSDPEQGEILRRNIALMKAWAAEEK